LAKHKVNQCHWSSIPELETPSSKKERDAILRNTWGHKFEKKNKKALNTRKPHERIAQDQGQCKVLLVAYASGGATGQSNVI